MDKQTRALTYLINLSFFLYFIILLVERILSVVLSLTNGVNLYGDLFNGYVYTLVFVSIVGWLVYLLIYCRDNIKALFKFNEDLDFQNLCSASGIILLSGMVHTEYTIPVIQFIAYGILILGILLEVIINHKSSQNKPLLWLSFVYLVCFSMAIPVMYRSFIEVNTLFHILEAFASFLLVGVFTCLLIKIFIGRDDLFRPWAIALLVALDVPLIVFRWEEEINYFVLIFLSLTVILFTIGFIYKTTKKNRE